ncbi:uncharacterized protein [Dendropsophus ebraccatus]|uniref:uncharacterized protein n=1 Tax=Dendropsophus ebraccatus TaxID=150705 RepID=UPI003831C194
MERHIREYRHQHNTVRSRPMTLARKGPGVCRKAPPWTDIVDFPENFTEITVNGSVVVSCRQRYEEKKLRLQCREEAGEFILTPDDGHGSCNGNKMPNWLSSLMISTFGFVVPFVVKLVGLLMMLIVKSFWMIKKKIRTYRKEMKQKQSLEMRSVNVHQQDQNPYIPPPSTAPRPPHRKQKRAEITDVQEEEEEEIYVNLQDEEEEENKVQIKKKKPKIQGTQ